MSKLYKLFIAAGILGCVAAHLMGCSNKDDNSGIEITAIMRKALTDTSSVFYADFESFPEERDSLPIGVFDSGTGGLTVLEVLLKADNVNNITGEPTPDGIPDFAGEDFQYLADQANMPYGTYSAEGKEDYLKELAVKDALFLLGDKYHTNSADKTAKGRKTNSKIIVIACNTATAYGLGDISNLLKLSNTGVKVIGVINAGVNAAFSDIKKYPSRDSLTIGVLGTIGTIASGAYERTINEVRQSSGYKGFIQVVNQPCAGFAESVDLERDYIDLSLTAPRKGYRGPVIGSKPEDIKEELMDVYNFDFSNNGILYKKEGGKYTDFQLNSSANYARFHLVSLFESARLSGKQVPIKSVIMGCTHYPFLLSTLNEVITELRHYRKNGRLLYAPFIADNFTFIDPAVFTALECYNALRGDEQLAFRVREGEVKAFISVPCYSLDEKRLDETGGLTRAFKYGRAVGTEEVTTVNVPFSKDNINPDNLKRIEKLVPESYEHIANSLN